MTAVALGSMEASDAGIPVPEIAASLGVHWTKVYQAMNRHGWHGKPGPRVRLTAPQADTLAQAYQAGASVRQLATQMGCAARTIARALRHQGVTIRPARGATR